MLLTSCTITGPDDRIDPKDLAAIAGEFPHVEWAVPIWPAQFGKPRYPKPEWIRDFKKTCAGCAIATHLNGDALRYFAEGHAGLGLLLDGFARIQLNIKLGKEMDYDIANLVRQVVRRVESDNTQFILQYGVAAIEDGLLEKFAGVQNISLLFDNSAGLGLLPDAWPVPVPGYNCGYAGGLGPHNLEAQMQAIARAAGERRAWVDMETRVRTNDDQLSLGKVGDALRITRPYAMKMGVGLAQTSLLPGAEAV